MSHVTRCKEALVPNLDGSRAAARTRRALGTHRHASLSTAAALGVAAALGWVVPAAGQATPATPSAPTTPTATAAPADTGLQPRIPATNNAASPFTADRASSEPIGLFPNQVADPFTYPAEPIVLGWTPAPGALTYHVEISDSPGFNTILYKVDTDQVQVAPELLLPDGQYWWRVYAVDKAGTKGIVSQVATFAKEWPSQLSGGVLSATPTGEATSVVRITPNMRWNHLPGGAYYETQIAPADQFATPSFFSVNYPHTSMTSGFVGVLPDDSYQWRVRALDANKNPGVWTNMGAFTKAWVPVNVTGPADGARVTSFSMSWDPLPGAEAYEVQVSTERFNWQGLPLVFSGRTGNTAATPNLKEMLAKSMSPGTYYWRVRPVVDNKYGTWSVARQLIWDPDSAPKAAVPTLTQAPDSANALSPTMLWTPVTGANIYRVDVATDAQFNNIVDQETTRVTSYTPRMPLPDNQVREGYFWRVVWGSGVTAIDPHWMEDEARVPVSQYRKQTQVTLGDAASGVVPEPPFFTWGDVPGAARYEMQISRDAEFAADRTQSSTVWGLGAQWAKDKGKRLAGGTWFWRVRAIDASGVGQTWSAPKTFTLNPPRVNITGPNDGTVVVGSPLMTWDPQLAACAYQVQTADNPGFQKSDTTAVPALQAGGGFQPGGTAVQAKPPDADGAVLTPQTALVTNGAVVTHPGTWYWRVRTQFCGDDDYSAWSPSRKFQSVRPPQFNLNSFPTTVKYGTRQVISGQLINNGTPVSQPKLILEQRVWPNADYNAYGTVTGDATGRFAFTLPITRTASWRLRWEATADHPEGIQPFTIRAVPRVTFSLARGRMVRTAGIKVKGTVFPRRDVQIQVKDSSGWKTIRTVKATTRFSALVRPKVPAGNQLLRAFVPQDAKRTLEPGRSLNRKLFVYDKFVVRRGR